MVKKSLKLWGKTSFNPPSKVKEELRCNWEIFQKEMEEKDVTCNLQKEEIQLQSQYQRSLKQEEELWQLKSISI